MDHLQHLPLVPAHAVPDFVRQLSDSSGVFKVTMFSELLSQKGELLQSQTPLLSSVSGRLADRKSKDADNTEESIRLTCQDISNLDAVLSQQVQT